MIIETLSDYVLWLLDKTVF